MHLVSATGLRRIARSGAVLLAILACLGGAIATGQAPVGAKGPQFDDRVPSDLFLVGFAYTTEKMGPDLVIRSLQPIHGDATGKNRRRSATFGKPSGKESVVEAPPGYAIGGLRVRSGERISGFSAIYYKIEGKTLNTKNSQESYWRGGKGGNGPKTLGGDGKLVLAVHGNSGERLDSLGLAMQGSGPVAKLPPKVEPAPMKSPPTPVGTTRDGNLLLRAPTLGGSTGTEFEDLSSARAILVGAYVTGGLSGTRPIIHSIQPVYLKPDGKKVNGETIGTPKGKLYTLGNVPEFAIASLDVNASNQGVHGLQAHLHRLKSNEFAQRLPFSNQVFHTDTGWVGLKGPIEDRSLAAAGFDMLSPRSARIKPIVGIHGRVDDKIGIVSLGVTRLRGYVEPTNPSNGEKAAYRMLGTHIPSLLFTPDGKSLVTGSRDGTITVWDAKDGKELRSFRSFGGAQALAVTPDGRTLAVGQNEGPSRAINLWDLTKGTITKRLGGTLSTPVVLHFSRSGDLLYSLGDNAYGVSCFDVATGKDVWPIGNKTDLVFPFGMLRWMAISGDGKTGAMANDDDEVHLWKTGKNVVHSTLPVKEWHWRIALSHNGNFLATCVVKKGELRLWDVATLKDRVLLTNGTTSELAFSPDEKLLATVSGDGLVLWSTASREKVKTLPFKGDAGCIAFSPDGQSLAAIAMDDGFGTGCRLCIWDIRSFIK